MASEFGGVEKIRSAILSDESLIPAMRRMAFQLLYNHKEIFDMLASGADVRADKSVLDGFRDILRDRLYIDRLSELAVSDIVGGTAHPETEIVLDKGGSQGRRSLYSAAGICIL